MATVCCPVVSLAAGHVGRHLEDVKAASNPASWPAPVGRREGGCQTVAGVGFDSGWLFLHSRPPLKSPSVVKPEHRLSYFLPPGIALSDAVPA
jgi:hypothetical protein